MNGQKYLDASIDFIHNDDIHQLDGNTSYEEDNVCWITKTSLSNITH